MHRIASTVIAAGLLTTGALLTAQAAPPAFMRDDGDGDLYLLTPDATNQIGTLRPGESLDWAIGAGVEGEQTGMVMVSAMATGSLVEAEDSMTMTVRGCDVPWQDGVCAQGERALLPEKPARQHDIDTLSVVDTVEPDEREWLLVTLRLGASPSRDVTGMEYRVGLRLIATGLEPTPSPSPTSPSPEPTTPSPSPTSPSPSPSPSPTSGVLGPRTLPGGDDGSGSGGSGIGYWIGGRWVAASDLTPDEVALLLSQGVRGPGLLDRLPVTGTRIAGVALVAAGLIVAGGMAVQGSRRSRAGAR